MINQQSELRIGTVCYATKQGLGYLAKSFYDAGIITDVLIYRHPHGEERSPTNLDWYPEGTPVLPRTGFQQFEESRKFVDSVDVILFFETPFDWGFLPYCKSRGVKTVLMPMYEWYPENPPFQFDYFLNPSLLDQEYFPQGTFIPVPVENDIAWHRRTLAKTFLHNSGHIGSRNHKGTLELLRAMEFVQSPIKLTVRSQDPEGLKHLAASAKCENDSRIEFVFSEIPRNKLFTTEHDVYIAPEKYNGLSLPLQEAFASGMAVMTSNRYPHNTWLPNEILIPVESTTKVRAAKGHLEIEESIINPVDIAAKIDEVYNSHISYYSGLGGQYNLHHNWRALKGRYLDFFNSLKGKS